MNCTFFTENEDLAAVVAKNLHSSAKKINKISTGWTNIVLEAETDDGDYIIRLPRTDFFSKQIEKDVEVSKFIKQNHVPIKTSEMEIYYDNGRPFSIHRKIPGIALTERLPHLSSDKIKKIAKSIAETFHKIHSIDIELLPESLKIRFYDFITSLPKLSEEDYNFSIFNGMLEDEAVEDKVFIYGDLNIGNILLNSEDEVEAFIDFSFCSIGDIYTDISVIASRIDNQFFRAIIDEYEKISGKTLNKNKIQDRKNVRDYVEQEYIKYMRAKHPEVKV